METNNMQELNQEEQNTQEVNQDAMEKVSGGCHCDGNEDSKNDARGICPEHNGGGHIWQSILADNTLFGDVIGKKCVFCGLTLISKPLELCR